jgi:hypothetical protein
MQFANVPNFFTFYSQMCCLHFCANYSLPNYSVIPEIHNYPMKEPAGLWHLWMPLDEEDEI